MYIMRLGDQQHGGGPIVLHGGLGNVHGIRVRYILI